MDPRSSPLRVLLLGGTTEASCLARALADDPRFDITLSLAGRTTSPAPAPVPTRIGGFGGAEGLAGHLIAHRIDLLVDATHPFASRMHDNAARGAAAASVPLLRIDRPAWRAECGDDWRVVPGMAAAAASLGPTSRCVLLTIGQKDLHHFARAAHRFVVRSVDPPPPDLLPDAVRLIARGPFAEADELALLQRYGVDTLVTKNSGGDATRAKLAAARRLRLPVIMVDRPPGVAAACQAGCVTDHAGALGWMTRHHAGRIDRGV